MKPRVYAALLILLLVAAVSPFTVALVSAANGSQLIYVRKHFDATWFFFDDKVVVLRNGENLTLEFVFANTKLSRLFNMDFQIFGDTVVYKYSLVRNFGARFEITVYHFFNFSPHLPAVKIGHRIVSNRRLPKILSMLFTVKAYLPIVENGTAHVKSKHLFFNWEDMVRNGVRFARRKIGSGIALNIDVGGVKTLTIDPTVGYDEGECGSQKMFVSYLLLEKVSEDTGTSSSHYVYSGHMVGMRFALSRSGYLKTISIWIRRYYVTTDLVARVAYWDDSAGIPGETLQEVTVPYENIPSDSFTWLNISFNVYLQAGTWYCIYFSTGGGDDTNNYRIVKHYVGSGGNLIYYSSSSGWETDPTYNLTHKLYVDIEYSCLLYTSPSPRDRG